MRLPKTLLLITFVAAIVLSVVYNKNIEHFADSNIGVGIGVAVGIIALLLAGFAFFGGSESITNINLKNFGKMKMN